MVLTATNDEIKAMQSESIARLEFELAYTKKQLTSTEQELSFTKERFYQVKLMLGTAEADLDSYTRTL
jgi:hypothetical protein